MKKMKYGFDGYKNARLLTYDVTCIIHGMNGGLSSDVTRNSQLVQEP